MFHQEKDVIVMELTNEVYNSVNKYFSVLKNLGYKSYNSVEQLLIFTFIEELLYSPLSQFITEKDYNDISNSLYCLYGSCMISFPDYKRSIDQTINNIPDRFRITDNGTLRVSNSDYLRTKA